MKRSYSKYSKKKKSIKRSYSRYSKKKKSLKRKYRSQKKKSPRRILQLVQPLEIDEYIQRNQADKINQLTTNDLVQYLRWKLSRDQRSNAIIWKEIKPFVVKIFQDWFPYSPHSSAEITELTMGIRELAPYVNMIAKEYNLVPPVKPVKQPNIPPVKNAHKYVMGPITLTEHYSTTYNKHIYIFGDLHDKRTRPCNLPDGKHTAQIHIAFFIEQLIRENIKNGKETDIFLEGIPKFAKLSKNEPIFEPLGDKYFSNVISEREKLYNALESSTDIQTQKKSIERMLSSPLFRLDRKMKIKEIWNNVKYTDEQKISQIKNFLRYGSTYLGDTVIRFEPYLMHQTSKIYSQDPLNFNRKARFHTVDIRDICENLENKFVQENRICQISAILSMIAAMFRAFGMFYTTEYTDEQNNLIKGFIDTIGKNTRASSFIKQNNLFNGISHDDMKTHIDIFLEKVGVRKEINRIREKEVKHYLEELLEDEIDETFKQIKEIQILLYQLQNSFNKEKDKMLGYLKNLRAVFLERFMDIYLLARVFKNSNFKHIIIYVGDVHAQYYRTCLDELGFITRNSIGLSDEDKTCVDVRSFGTFFKV
jgi:hypothetical protein